jgi:hypothetical protein
MEVKATFTLTLKAQKILTRSRIFPLARTLFNTVTYTLFLLFSLVARPHVEPAVFWVPLCAALFGFALMAFNYFLLPKLIYQKSHLRNCTIYYLFTDEMFQTYVKSENTETRSKERYETLMKVQEFPDYLFLHRNQNEAFIIDKASIAPGDLTLLRNRLRTAGIYDCKLRNS